MKVANKVEIVELHIEAFGTKTTLNPTLVWDDESAVLIDAGMPSQFEQIKTTMENIGVPFDKLTAVILTHQDIDHLGGLPELLQHSTNHIEVYAHDLDKPYIEGTLHLMKTDPNKMDKQQWESLPNPLQHLYANPPKVKVTQTLHDNQVLPYCGGIKVISTPGHTPGHVSLYLSASKVLVAGDSMIAANGTLRGPVKQTTPNVEEAIRSLKKFLPYDIEAVICYHGGLINENVKDQLQSLVNQGMDAVVTR